MKTFLCCSFSYMLGIYFCLLGISSCKEGVSDQRPNIIIIVADDMGYGNINNCRIKTPNLNKLAEEGLIFTDAHSASAVCTPSRYGLLTGRYCWRTRLTSGTISDYAGTLIEPGRITIGNILKEKGYYAGLVGKWHLGFDWALHDESADSIMATNPKYSDFDNIDFTSFVRKGINEFGFDYSFVIAGSAEMDPSTFIENGKVVSIPIYTSKEIREKTGEWYGRDNNHIAEGFTLEGLVPTFSRKACEFIENTVNEYGNQPFFLYYALTTPHNPIIPNKEFIGKSNAGSYGDFIMELDWHVGKLVDKIENLKIEKNTMIIFTSDNGAIDMTKNSLRWIRGDPNIYGHMANAPFRGWKRQRLEGGHHVPFFIKWPEKIKPGEMCSTTICLNDILPTFAEMLNIDLDNCTAEDGKSFFRAITGENRPVSFHEAIVHHAADGQFAIHKGNFKLMIDGPVTPTEILNDSIPVSFVLYDLQKDIREINDASFQNKEIVKEMYDLLKFYINEGKSN